MDDGMNNIENSEIQEIMDTDDNESSSSVPNEENGLDDANLELDNQDKMFENEESSDTNGLVEELDSNDGLLTKEVDRSPEEIIGEVSSPIQDNVINEVMEDSEVAEDSESKDGVDNDGAIEINEDSASMDVTEISEVEGVLQDDSDSNAISETAQVFVNESSVTIEEVDETSSDLLKTIDNNDEEQVIKTLEVVKAVEEVEAQMEADGKDKVESLQVEPEGKEKNEAEVKPECEEKVEAQEKLEDKDVAPVEELGAEEKLKKKDSDNKAVVSSNVEKQDLEKKKAEIKRGDAEETEIVSEDELPQVEKPKIKDAENVSDDELPGPKPAEMPADTEVVSEDELPTVKKDSGSESRKRKNEETKTDPKEESESKKQAIAKNGESKPVSEKAATVEEKPAPKVLPELDKYWKVVNDDPTDFTGWTYLLQYVDQENDVEAARGAYDAFLSHYPYCYGYWRKYSDYEKRKGSKTKCNEVLERGLKAIPLSVDLWIHYLNHIKSTRTEDLAFIRSQYERAIEACGLEFRSDRLWESYVKWEAENGSALNVTNIYDRLLATPTMSYTTHFDNFQEHVMSEPVSGVVSRAELIRLRTEVRAGGKPPQLDLPPGEDEPDDHIASEEEAQAIKDRIIAIRKKVHKTTADEVAARWTFEEGIKRPYFHVKPLERCQLKNWKAYLEWEKQNGSFKRAYILHERCLIACALYDEFWLKLVRLLEERAARDPSVEAVQRSVLERACGIHHARRPALHLCWSAFEEAHGDTAKAAQILEKIDETCPDVLEVQCRRINLERRRGDLDKCAALYQQYIAGAKTKAIGSALAVKYARFLRHVKNDLTAAREALDAAIVTNPLDPRLHLQRLDLALHTPDTPFSVLDELVCSYSQQEGAEAEVALMFAWRRRELAEELGDLPALRAALAAHADAARRPRPSKTEESSKKKEATSNNSTAAPSTGAYYANNAPPQNYDQGYAAQPYPNNWGYTQPPGPYQPNWQQYPNYY